MEYSVSYKGGYSKPANNRTFAYDLQGTWVSNDPSVYSGKLVIDLNRITITGYRESQTPIWDNDNKRPFKNFIKNVPIRGYSNDGKLFIEDRGSYESISYTLYTTGTYPQHKFLRFSFGGRLEILQKE